MAIFVQVEAARCCRSEFSKTHKTDDKVVDEERNTQLFLNVDTGGSHIGFQTQGCLGYPDLAR